MKKHFITGLVILLPLAVTVAVVIFLVNFFTKPFIGLVSGLIQSMPGVQNGLFFFSQDQIISYVSKILILLALFFFTIGLGLITRWFLLHHILKGTEKIIQKIPLVNMVYKTSQDIIKTLFTSDKKSFQRVVMVPFPRVDVYVIGLIARESPPCML